MDERTRRVERMAAEMRRHQRDAEGRGAELYALSLIQTYTTHSEAYGYQGTIGDVAEVMDALTIVLDEQAH